MNVLVPLAIGFAFGWLLQKSGLSRYDRIVGVFRFADLAVLRFVFPIHARVISGARSRSMSQAVPVGDCNECHTERGTNGAPGRLMAP